MILCLAADITSFGQKPSKTTDLGVVINGVRWATRNVDTPGTFADKPEDAGKFYQWNRKKAWNTTYIVIEGWDASTAEGEEWDEANDPSPAGWRVPTLDEIKSLLDKEKVTNEWITQSGIDGRKFTDKATGNSIFLPAAGFRRPENGVRAAYVMGSDWLGGYYWSSTPRYETDSYTLYILDDYADWATNLNSMGRCLRSVALI